MPYDKPDKIFVEKFGNILEYEHSLRAGAFVQCESDNAVSGGRSGGNKAAKTTLLGLLCSSMSAEPPPKSRDKWKEVCETDFGRASSDSHPMCPQPRRGDERQRPHFESAKALNIRKLT